MKKKSKKKPKKNMILDLYYSSNPFDKYAFVMIIMFVVLGGALPALVGFIAATYIIKIGRNDKYSKNRKILYTILITIGAIFAALVLVAIVISLLS